MQSRQLDRWIFTNQDLDKYTLHPRHSTFTLASTTETRLLMDLLDLLVAGKVG